MAGPWTTHVHRYARLRRCFSRSTCCNGAGWSEIPFKGFQRTNVDNSFCPTEMQCGPGQFRPVLPRYLSTHSTVRQFQKYKAWFRGPRCVPRPTDVLAGVSLVGCIHDSDRLVVTGQPESLVLFHGVVRERATEHQGKDCYSCDVNRKARIHCD